MKILVIELNLGLLSDTHCVPREIWLQSFLSTRPALPGWGVGILPTTLLVDMLLQFHLKH